MAASTRVDRVGIGDLVGDVADAGPFGGHGAEKASRHGVVAAAGGEIGEQVQRVDGGETQTGAIGSVQCGVGLGPGLVPVGVGAGDERAQVVEVDERSRRVA